MCNYLPLFSAKFSAVLQLHCTRDHRLRLLPGKEKVIKVNISNHLLLTKKSRHLGSSTKPRLKHVCSWLLSAVQF